MDDKKAERIQSLIQEGVSDIENGMLSFSAHVDSMTLSDGTQIQVHIVVTSDSDEFF